MVPSLGTMGCYIASDFESAYEGVFRPWIQSHANAFQQDSKPVVVVVPSTAISLALRARLAEERIGFAGISFWLPEDLRAFLDNHLFDEQRTLSNQGLRIVLSSTANAATNEGGSNSAAAIASYPDGLLQAIAQLEEGGWGGEDISDPALRELSHRHSMALQKLKVRSRAKTDFWMCSKVELAAEKRIGSLLFWGFHGAHWRYWSILKAAARVSADITVSLRFPKNDSLCLDATWIGSWEGLAGGAELVAASSLIHERPTFGFAESVCGNKTASTEIEASGVKFVAGVTIADQAALAVRCALAAMGKKEATRIAILVPTRGVLSNEIAAKLDELGVLYWNDVGTFGNGPFESPGFRSLLAFAREPSPHTLVALLRYNTLKDLPFTPDMIERAFGSIRTQSFVHDFRLQIIAMRDAGDKKLSDLGEFLENIPRLPDLGLVSDHVRQAKILLSRFGWKRELQELFPFGGEHEPLEQVSVTRDVFMDWLESRATSRNRSQGEFGSHPYARLYLCSYEAADGLSWSDTVQTGLNDGHYPPPYSSSGYLGESTIFELNEKVRRLNLASKIETSDSPAVIEGKGQITGPVEERWSQQQAFITNLEESVFSASVLLSAEDETRSRSSLRPSEYLIRMWEARFGRPFSIESLALGAQGTSRRQKIIPIIEVKSAYEKRRDVTRPFDEYSFAFHQDHPSEIRLSGSRWESSFERPVEAWSRGALGLSFPRKDTSMPWNLTVGEWAHRWIAGEETTFGQVFVRRGNDFSDRVETMANADLLRGKKHFAQLSRPVPQWWFAAYDRSLFAARRLASSLDSVSLKEWPVCLSEYTLPSGICHSVRGKPLHISGRMDFVFMDRIPKAISAIFRESPRCWLFDCKTGSNQPLSPSTFSQGKGVQLGLYALGLAAMGAADVLLTLLKPGAETVAQLTLAEVRRHTRLWEHILFRQETGRFGQREVLRSEFGVVSLFPIATLQIAKSILDRKSELSFNPLE